MTELVKEFYCNDVVYRFDSQGRIVYGVVLDTYENSDQDESHVVAKGELFVFWLLKLGTGGKERTIKQEKVKLVSRTLMEGDIVRRLENGVETQRGYCRSIQLRSVVHVTGTSAVIENVSHDRFMYIHPFERGLPATVGERFGRISSCEYSVTLASRDGSMVEFVALNHKISFKNSVLGDEPGFHLSDYPIGTFKTIVPASLHKATWIKKTKMMRQNFHKLHLFVVHKIQPVEVILRLHNVETSRTELYKVPKEDIPRIKVIQPVDLYVPEFFEQRALTILPDDRIVDKTAWLASQTRKHVSGTICKQHSHARSKQNNRTAHLIAALRRSRSRRPERTTIKEGDDAEWVTDEEEELWDFERAPTVILGQPVIIETLCLDSKATIVWQDGSVEDNVPTTELYYSISLDDHEFFPGEYVIGPDDNPDIYGVIQKVLCIERTAQVKWFTFEDDSDTPHYSHTEEMSVYDIKRHPDYIYRPGNVVYSYSNEMDNLGTVIDSYPDGLVKVKWLDGTIRGEWPSDICILEVMGMPSFDASNDDDDTKDPSLSPISASWETDSVEEVMGEHLSEPTWEILAARLNFILERLGYLKEALLQRDPIKNENISFLKNLLSVYENSSYLDKLLGTQLFSLENAHYQSLLAKIKEHAKGEDLGIPSNNTSRGPEENKNAQMESLNKVMKLEFQLKMDMFSSSGEPRTLQTLQAQSLLELPDVAQSMAPINSLCLHLLSMLHCRLNLAVAEIINLMLKQQTVETVDVMCTETPATPVVTPATSTPCPTLSNTPEDSLTSITSTPLKPGDCPLDPEHLTVTPVQSKTVLVKPEVHTLPLALPAIVTPEKSSCTEESSAGKAFEVIEEAPLGHHYYANMFEPNNPKRFYHAVMNEAVLLRDSLPPGVWVYGFADRADLYSVMIRGPDNTPYEDGLFIFDLQLSPDYPRTPPQCNYTSYNSERLNPNLYVEGRVCVSLLGTWMGRGTEVWGPKSTLLQLIVSIQGLILVTEPYYNEAGYDRQYNSQQGYENSRTYNELVLLRLVQSMTDMLEKPHIVFRKETYEHFRQNGDKLYRRLLGWIEGEYEKEPEFPLLPVSRGLKLSLPSCLNKFKQMLEKHADR